MPHRHGEGGATNYVALRLARLLGCSPEQWLDLKRAHDIARTLEQHGAEIAKVEPLHPRQERAPEDARSPNRRRPLALALGGNAKD